LTLLKIIIDIIKNQHHTIITTNNNLTNTFITYTFINEYVKNNTQTINLLGIEMKIYLSIILLMLSEFAYSSCQIDIVPYQLSFFHNRISDSRFKYHPAKLSGDGKKIVYIQSASGFSTSLSGWLSAKKQALTSDNAAKVYLYDVQNKQSSLIYTGNFSFTNKNGEFFQQSLENNFSVDINNDGSQVILAYNKTSLNSKRDVMTRNLIFSAIDTKTGNITPLITLNIPNAQSIPFKLSGNGSHLVFIYSPALNKTTTIFGVESLQQSHKSILASFLIQEGTKIITLSQGSGDNQSDSEVLNNINAENTQSFDINYDGSRVIFGYPNTGEIIGVKSDASLYHTIATIAANKGINVAISGDGKVVAYADRGQDTSILYKNDFIAGNQTVILNKKTNSSGNLFLNNTGTALLFNNNIAQPGFTFGFSSPSYFVYTDGSMIVSQLNKNISDVSHDFSEVLSTYYDSAALDLNFLTSGSQYFPKTNSLYLSSLYVNEQKAIAYEIIMQIIDTNPLRFKLKNYTTTAKANINAIYYPKDKLLTIPYVAVGDKCYQAELKLTDSSNFIFELSSLQNLQN